MKTINIVLKIEDSELNNFDHWLRQQLDVVDIKVLPNTNKLYEEDSAFRKMVKAVKEAQKVRDVYINENN